MIDPPTNETCVPRTDRAEVRSWYVSLIGPDGSRRKDRPLHVKGHVTVWLVAGFVLAILWSLSLSPRLVETVYTEGVGQVIARALAAVSGVIPFSLIEILLTVIVVWAGTSIFRAVYHVARRERRVLNALGCGLVQAVTVVAVIICYFYTSWGLNYARAGLVARMHWEPLAHSLGGTSEDPIDVEELARLCTELVEMTNAAYAEACGSEDVGRPSSPESLGDVDNALDRAYKRVAESLSLHPSFAASRGGAKPVLASLVMCYAGVLGFYNPITGEANYNRLMPGSELPHIMAHEKAHQRGIASEDEASFLGYLACAFSENPYVRYSGYLFAQQTLFGELFRLDSDRGVALVKQRYAGVSRDIEAENAFTAKYMGRYANVGRAINDAYLKANRVKDGVLSYQRSAQLLVVYARFNNGSCVVSTVGPAS